MLPAAIIMGVVITTTAMTTGTMEATTMTHMTTTMTHMTITMTHMTIIMIQAAMTMGTMIPMTMVLELPAILSLNQRL